MTTNNLNNLKNEIDYLTSISRYWIENGDWDTANTYIDKAIEVENKYNAHYQYVRNSSTSNLINAKETFICQH